MKFIHSFLAWSIKSYMCWYCYRSFGERLEPEIGVVASVANVSFVVGNDQFGVKEGFQGCGVEFAEGGGL